MRGNVGASTHRLAASGIDLPALCSSFQKPKTPSRPHRHSRQVVSRAPSTGEGLLVLPTSLPIDLDLHYGGKTQCTLDTTIELPPALVHSHLAGRDPAIRPTPG